MAREILQFLRFHWPHALLLLPGVLLMTLVHESAHAIAVLLQDGTISKFVWLPSAGSWGYVSFQFPQGVTHSTFLVSFAPYLLWVLIAGIACCVAFGKRQHSALSASFLFCWAFAAPLADVANAALPYLLGSSTDFRFALGHPSLAISLLIVFGGMGAVIVGYYLQRRLYGSHSLGRRSYIALSATALFLIAWVAIDGPIG